MASFSATNFAGLSIPELGAVPFHQTLELYGLTGQISNVEFHLTGLKHSYSMDLDMLLVGPVAANNLVFWSDVGLQSDPDGDFTVSDNAANVLPRGGPLLPGTYKPTDQAIFLLDPREEDGDFGSSTGGTKHAAPAPDAATFATSFNNIDGNGTWNYYLRDDRNGNGGSLEAWGLTMQTTTSTVQIIGTGGDDLIIARSTGLTSGFYAMNDLATVSYTGVTHMDIFCGAGNDTVYAAAEADTIYGGDGADLLNGGMGADLLYGGIGNDIFYVDNTADRVFDTAGAANGNDTVFAAVSYGLAADAAIEALATTAKAGTGAISLAGNNFAQNISGNNGANVIVGLGGNDVISGNGGADKIFGGLGNDTLIGGAGNDGFFFDTKANATTNHDTIADFSNASGNNDTIYLENAVYTTLAAGSLGGAFQSNTAGLATQADDRIIYETDTGNLYYDVNGSAAGGSILFATLTGHPAITASDFVVI